MLGPGSPGDRCPYVGAGVTRMPAGGPGLLAIHRAIAVAALLAGGRDGRGERPGGVDPLLGWMPRGSSAAPSIACASWMSGGSPVAGGSGW